MCAAREGGWAERLLWTIIGRTRTGLMRYTDDTHMTLAVARHLVNHETLDQDELALSFAENMEWSRGYGPSTVFVLKKIRKGLHWKKASTLKYPEGSFGNGAAMRIAPAALLYHNRPSELQDVTARLSEITHPNTMAIFGAHLIARSIICGLNGTLPANAVDEMILICKMDGYLKKLVIIREKLDSNTMPDPAEFRRLLGTGMAAVDSCPAALLIGFYYRTRPFVDLIRYVNRCKGDTDTIGAMAGAIWGAYNGFEAIPSELVQSLEDNEKIQVLSEALFKKSMEYKG
jgi:poly(ADP-ribose) glycohydrolase ARH3